MRIRTTFMTLAVCLAFCSSPAFAKTTVNIAVVVNPTFVHTQAANWFKEDVEKKLPGKYDIVVHHSGALGSETQVLQQIQLGTTQMSVCTTGPIEAFVPEIKALEMPFLFPSYQAADTVLDGPIGQDLAGRLDKQGFTVLHFLDNGFRNVTNSKKPIKTPTDLAGMKIRTMEAPTHLAIWRALGANPTPMAWPIFTALQQGVIDGQENPIAVIYAAKLNEAGQKYLTLSRHVYSALVFIGNKTFMDGLPEADRQVFLDAARDAALRGRAFIRDNEARQLAELQAAGMEIEEHPDMDAFRKATEPVLAGLDAESKKIVKQIQQAVK
ncbi:DctP family TRAP transporter solute-binding subunit [Desulfopila sp. IMCC35006]|uniref:DctP family TRAP transporter solute-binding subunit n=1 Tax=Desulfopila sp. IMCC35006 TaxID=2569542 RepID=UPI0010ACE013|nr:DctP family TRAP transporter solute-binding subunit [Desulfopila sp. IMCC35006]TKB28233.1 DctP family TRAP transporter solute-binding subunit [Desulfopila sp. IMCC35006]